MLHSEMTFPSSNVNKRVQMTRSDFHEWFHTEIVTL